jgi:hypothetical protein
VDYNIPAAFRQRIAEPYPHSPVKNLTFSTAW